MYKIRALLLIATLALHMMHTQVYAKTAITTIPKSGTHLFQDLLTELQIQIPCGHFAELKDCSDGVSDKTVIVVRDLKDVMVSAVYWCEELAKMAAEGAGGYKIYSHFAQHFLKKADDEKLQEIIEHGGNVYVGHPSLSKNLMSATQRAVNLIMELLKRPSDSIFVIRFEEIIGKEAGGTLEDAQRWELLSRMFQFLGYEILPAQIEKAFGNIYSKSRTYNPIKKKVGRWKEHFDQDHMEAFLLHWGASNAALGYHNF